MSDETIEVPNEIESHPAWKRLNDQLAWYGKNSRKCKKWYTRLRVFQTVLAVLIPIASHLPPDVAKWATSISGAVIAILEGIQQINQYATLWVQYRSTAENLKHHKFLLLSSAGPYKDLDMADQLITLSENVEEIVSTEHAKWIKEAQQSTKDQKREGEN